MSTKPGSLQTVSSLSKEFGPTETSIRHWIKQAGLDAGERHDGLTTEERQELVRLRREVRVLREEAGFSQKTLAARLGLPWQLVALWESYPSPASPRAYPTHEPTASQLQDLARTLDAHPSDFFHSHEDAPASEKEEERAAGKASCIRLDGEKLARMRKLRGLSYPQAAARARVPGAVIHAAEAGRTINTGALLRLLHTYESRRDPVDGLATIVLSPKWGKRQRK